MNAPRPGWAEQDPELWWNHLTIVTREILSRSRVDKEEIRSIGISYQMHGLVLVDKSGTVLRPSIIWCDSRAVGIGRNAFEKIGKKRCLETLLNSPGNFTASKLRWVQENEPAVYANIHKFMLPGDYIAFRLTGEMTTSISGLSEGILWDFKKNSLAAMILKHYDIDKNLICKIVPTFGEQGRLTPSAANELGLTENTPVSYRAGDQANNAFSLNVLNPGEAAATAGTSGVVYAVTDKIQYDPKSRVNPFAHVNHASDKPRLGVLLCINGTGILNSWLRRNVAAGMSYGEINTKAAEVAIGSEGVTVLPFGNGSERILENQNIGCQIFGLNFNRHSRAHLFRASQEGIAFSFKYGLDIMKEMGMDIRLIRAGHGNLFLSPIFRQTLANISDATIEIYDTDGALGAARGGAIGVGFFTSFQEAFKSLKKMDEVHPSSASMGATRNAYDAWLVRLRRNQE